MESAPREITTNQFHVHEGLADIVNTYRQSGFKKPIAEHTQQAFDSALLWLSDWQGDVIIDACCGVGESSIVLAQRNPNARVLGVDKSIARLEKYEHYKRNSQDNLNQNVRLFQADLNDFWRLLAEHQSLATWTISKQCLFYPNPYPKKAQVKKRWHASPALVPMLACSKRMEVRSNWLIYLQEFQLALRIYGIQSVISVVAGLPITPFERKYSESGQQCWQLQTVSDGEDK
ncbi:MAG: tRNA (guanine-N7-)-methyltransferase [Glaciecola sp.]|jgi:tRNA (guanine-N7-)-methyltransferase